MRHLLPACVLAIACSGCSFSTSTQTQAGIRANQQSLATAIADYTALVNRYCKERTLTEQECVSQYERIAAFVAAAAELRTKTKPKEEPNGLPLP